MLISQKQQELGNEERKKKKQMHYLFKETLTRFEKIKADFKGWTSNLAV